MGLTQPFKVKDFLLDPRTKPNNTLYTKIQSIQISQKSQILKKMDIDILGICK